ncbi:MAG: ParB/RepB/Spo0J family partition protein [Burkholderiales bacterium]|nr:ParB/RepB/Spo0J family partition protein [Burkholderiales bacterium]
MSPANKKRGLGRGLDALLAGENTNVVSDAPATLPLSALTPGRYQPRTRMDDVSLAELAGSIRAQGVIQPILVRRLAGTAGRYEIIAGERRFRAAALAGLTDVPVTVREVADDAALAMALIENIQREDLNAIEEAQGIARLIDEFGMTQEAAGEAVGRSRTAAANLLRLLKLPDAVKEMIHAGTLDMGHARALLGLPAALQASTAQAVVARGMSVRQTEELVKKTQAGAGAGEARGKARPPASRDTTRFADEVADLLGAKVEIQPSAKGGRLVIHYASNDHLNDLVARLRG